MRLHIGRSYTFDASHHLEGYDGPCRRQHGHTYAMEITISGLQALSGPKRGMVMDYGDLDAIVEELILSKLDHYDLNEALPDLAGTTTAENLALWIFTVLDAHLQQAQYQGHVVKLERVRLQETPRSWAEVTR